MARNTERDASTMYWYGLLSPGRPLERRAELRGFLDAWRDVRSQDPDLAQRLAGPGERRRDGFYYVESEADYYPPAVGELAAWTTSTLEALGAVAQTKVGEHNARVEGLKARLAGKDSLLRGRPSLAAAPAAGVPDEEAGSASRPAAQARRRARLAAQDQAAAEGSLVALQVELAEAVALRAAAVKPLRDTAGQVQAFGSALQHLYWAMRIRCSRRRHGAKPIAAYVIVPWPAWVTDDDVLFDVQPKTTTRTA